MFKKRYQVQMKSVLLVSIIAGIGSFVSGDCDVMKCLGHMTDIDYSNTAQTCSSLKIAVSCLHNVVNTCQSVDLRNNQAVMTSLNQATTQTKEYCESTDGVVVPAGGGLPAECDSVKCIQGMTNIDLTDQQAACPFLGSAIGCMDNVLDTCQYLGEYKSSVQDSIDSAKVNFRQHCGDYNGAGSYNNMIQFIIPVAMVTILFNYLIGF